MIVGLAGSYFLVLPRLQAANLALLTADSQLTADRQNLAALTQVSVQVKKVDQALSSQGVDLKKAQQVLPPFEDMPSLYIQMEALTAQAQASIGTPTYTVGAPTKDPAGGSIQIPVSISGNGDYPHLKAFLSSFEQNIRPVTFTQLSFTIASATATPAPDKAGPLPKGAVTLSATGYVRATGLSAAFAAPAASH